MNEFTKDSTQIVHRDKRLIQIWYLKEHGMNEPTLESVNATSVRSVSAKQVVWRHMEKPVHAAVKGYEY